MFDKDNYVFQINAAKKTIVEGIKHPLPTIKKVLLHPLVISAFLMAFTGYLNGVSITFAQEQQRIWHKRHPDVKLHQFELYDILFKWFDHKDAVGIADKYLAGLIAFMAINILYSSQRFVIVQRYLICMSLMFLIRIPTVYLTILNDPSHNQSTVSGNPLIEGLLIAGGTHVSTVDKLYSGHTGSLTIAGLILLKYYDKTFIHSVINGTFVEKFFKPLIIMYLIGGYVLFTIARIHYTVDVFIAFTLATMMFHLYHNYILLAPMKESALGKFVTYLQRGADDIPSLQIETK